MERCPYCGKEMSEGFLQSNGQIYFNTGRKPKIFASGDLKSRNLSRFSLLKAPFVKASYCDNCKKIIADTGK